MPNYVQYFGYKVEDVAESWVEAEKRWVEVDGAGWRWVHSLTIAILIKDLVKTEEKLVSLIGVCDVDDRLTKNQKPPPEVFY